MKRKVFFSVVSLTALLVSVLSGFFLSTHVALAAFQPKSPPLTTPWTSQVSTTNPLPEYPRPQMTRNAWQSLNGQWQFAGASSNQNPPFGQNLAETVLVPYPIESALSGIQRHESHMWYRQNFTVPAGWNGQRTILNFGAVDWQATVYVNGHNVGSHSGGYGAFSFDITDQLNGGNNELIVGVYAPVDSDGVGQPIGKQRLNPGSIWYTASSGIWQTVWLEPAPFARITRLDMTPDVGGQSLKLTVQGAGINGQTVQATASTGGNQVGSATGNVGSVISIPVPNPHLWSPNDPFLYDLQVSLKSGSTTGDQVGSYFGMRSVGVANVNGILRPVINGQFIFQLGTLDQGFWPDGIYTAPTDTALKFDIQRQKDLGFDMLRKHIKVEPARWYYWADKIGMMVWQDMPAQFGNPPSGSARTEFENELHEMVTQHISSPSIIQWVVLNEGWGQYDQARLANTVKSWDPSRLVDNMSGVNCCGSVDGGNGDVIDDHIYVGPGSPAPSATRYAALGEFGGLGLVVPGHQFANGFSYEMEPDSATLTNRYVGLMQQVQSLIGNGLSAAVYTQFTDVELELNGIMTYDRQVMKMDTNAITNANRAVITGTGGSGGVLQVNTVKSLQVTTPGYTDHYAQVAGGLGITAVVNGGSGIGSKQAASFRIVAGLADTSCYSFASVTSPTTYLRHYNYRIHSDQSDGSNGFKLDATFCARTGLSGGDISLESKNYPGYYIRHRNSELWLDQFQDNTLYRQDATWHVANAWFRSGVTLDVNALHSFQVTTPGFTDRSIRHYNGLGYTEVVNGGSAVGLRQDATFRIVAGLADNTCYSFESLNFPGQYLHHSQYRIHKDASDGSATFNQDATFCAQPGLSGQGVSLQSYNFPDHYIRHYNAEVWIASNGGANPSDNPTSYAQDVSWNVIAPWAS